MTRYVYMIMTAPKEGQEAAFNTFYEQQHIPDVLRVPGFVGCRRLRLSSELPSSEGAAPYVALYDIETDDLPGAIAELRRRLGTPDMPTSNTSEPSRAARYLYDVIFETQVS